MKNDYEQPLTKVYDIRLEGSLLTGSVESMQTITGLWEEDDE